MMTQKEKIRRRRRKKLSNTMVLLLVFLLFLTVFGGICLWAVVQINNTRHKNIPSSTVTSSSDSAFTEEDTRNLLIVTTDEGSAQGFVVVHMDAENDVLDTLSIPRDTMVDVETAEMRLYELTDKQGIAAARTALQKLTGLTLHNYASITYKNMEKAIQHFETGVVFTLKENVEFRDNNNLISITTGVRTLTAPQAVGLLRYPSWKEGRIGIARVQAELITALLNQYLRSARMAKVDTDFSALVNLAKMDILVSHFNAVKPTLEYLASKNKGSLCKTMLLKGEYTGSGDALRYYAAENIAQTLPDEFR